MMYTSLDAQEKGRAANESFAQKYKKPLIFLASVAVIVSIILLIVFVLLEHTGRPAEGPEKYPFTLDSIFNSSLSPKSFSLQWDKSGQSYLYQDPITRHWYRKTIADLNSNTSTLVVNVTELAEAIPNYAGFSFSPDGSALLVAVNETSIWRHSFTAAYLIYTISTKAVHSLVPGNPQIQNVVWNPANSLVAYVFENNIYTVDTTNYAITTVTTDGNEDGILNGVQSWVYEEEIFSDSKALWWSTDGSKLAYLRFDESEVPIFEYTLYNGNPYPTEVPLRYPKAGYTNPSVSLYVWDTAINNQSAFPAVEFGGDETWEYIASVQWDANNVLWTQQLNRYQNHSAIISYTYNAGTWTADTVFTQFSAKWIEINPIFFCGGYNLAILPSGDHFHIATLGTNNQAPAFQTSGNFDVISYAGCTKAGKILYLATPAIDPTNPVAASLQQIYELDLTTDVSVKVGKGVGVYTATSFSPLGDYFVMRYLGPDVPQVFLVSTDFATNITLQDNKIYAEIITHYDFPTKKYTTVKGEAGDILNAFYKEPVGTDDDSNRPLIINVYAGPGTQKVQQTHEVAGLDAWLALQGYVVASIDGRGTGRRGLAFLQATYKQLGLLEIADQRAGAKDLADKLGFVDSGRVAIWGWSFGGFMAAHGIAGTSGIDGFDFKASVSVAPVSDWRYYDSVYTERYMSTPQDNPSGYNATSVLQYAGNTPANKLLLMHGTGDDNVHFQNTVELVNVLITSNVQFETMFYPNDDHSINSGNARKYLYEKMTHFLEQEL